MAKDCLEEEQFIIPFFKTKLKKKRKKFLFDIVSQ